MHKVDNCFGRCNMTCHGQNRFLPCHSTLLLPAITNRTSRSKQYTHLHDPSCRIAELRRQKILLLCARNCEELRRNWTSSLGDTELELKLNGTLVLVFVMYLLSRRYATSVFVVMKTTLEISRALVTSISCTCPR